MADVKRTTPTRKPAHPTLVPKPNADVRRTLAELAAMGGGEVAYIRAFRAAELRHLFPQTAELHPSVRLFALFGADGAPLMLADSRDAIMSGAWQHDLDVTVLH
jgi:hypothetical protein